MLGNAVPSLLAEVIAREMADQLLSSPMPAGLELLPPARPGGHAQEPLLPVKQQYLAYAADHEDHPGTGRGNRAQLRRLQAA